MVLFALVSNYCSCSLLWFLMVVQSSFSFWVLNTIHVLFILVPNYCSCSFLLSFKLLLMWIFFGLVLNYCSCSYCIRFLDAIHVSFCLGLQLKSKCRASFNLLTPTPLQILMSLVQSLKSYYNLTTMFLRAFIQALDISLAIFWACVDLM
jgi:hypothetical protein